MPRVTLTFLSVLVFAPGILGQEKDQVARLIGRCRAALKDGKPEDAMKLADQAVEAGPKEPRAYLARGVVHESQRRHKEAIADFTKCIELDPKMADAYQHRGGEQFKLSEITESLADFDKFLELRPDEKPGHWQRGISLYYAGKYAEGAAQFKAGEKVFGDDVENAVWHYLCNRHIVGDDKARAGLLKISKDRRVPMMVVYDLFAGKATPEDVMTAVQEGKPKAAELKNRLFYAHLYSGLYYDAVGDKTKARDHLRKAGEDMNTGGYMGDVARVHLATLTEKQPDR
jgi:lipoprotein NlpI